MRLTEQLVDQIADAGLCRLPFAALPRMNQAEGQRYLLDAETSLCFLRSSRDLVLDDNERCLTSVVFSVRVLVGACCGTAARIASGHPRICS